MPSTIVWPDWMPKPERDSFNIQPEDRREITETEVGGVIRYQFDSDINIADCKLILNPAQAKWFASFERDVLRQGSVWFSFPIWEDGDVEWEMCRFKSRPKSSVAGHLTIYTFTLYVATRSNLYDPCLMEMLTCWSPCEAVEISENLNEAINSLRHTTIIPSDLIVPVWDVFVVSGQSNAVGYGVYTLTASSSSGAFYDWNSASPTYRQFHTPIADPVYVSTRGGAWVSFVDRYYELTGRHSIIVNVGSGGAAVTDYGTTTNTWADNAYGTLRTSRAAVLANLKTDLANDGRRYRIAGLLWCQGESEGGRILANQVTAADYKAGTIDVWSWFRTQLGKPNLPIFVSQIGYADACFTNEDRKIAYEAVQLAQTELCNSQQNVYMGFNGAKDFYSSDGTRLHMSDSIHYDATGYHLMGQALAEKAAQILR